MLYNGLSPTLASPRLEKPEFAKPWKTRDLSVLSSSDILRYLLIADTWHDTIPEMPTVFFPLQETVIQFSTETLLIIFQDD